MVRFARGQRGFVMMDALAALALLTTAVFTSVVFFRNEVRASRTLQERFAASLIAESEMERLHTLRYDDIPIGADQALNLALPSAKQLKQCAATLSVRQAQPGLKEATVRVQWRSPTGRPLLVEMRGAFSRAGIEP